MPNSIPWWSLSHWYVWLPLGLLICAPGFFVISKIIWSMYKERRDRKLLYLGVISLNELRRRRRV